MSKSFYNIYRPQNFNEVIGQVIPKKILINSIKKNKLNNSYLFYGIRGTGKTTLARIFAKALNCLNLQDDFNPCNKCESCLSINTSSSFDVIEIDAASNNGVDEIREIKEKSNYLTTNSKYKIYIIDEIHMLSKAAFNALLKTLEEPPRSTIFLLITTEITRIPDTILSRNLIINLEKVSEANIILSLKNILEKENVKYQENALNYIALLASGSIRDAISLLELVLLYSQEFNEENVVQSLRLLKNSDIKKGIEDIDFLINVIEDPNLDIKKVVLQIIDQLTKLIIMHKSENYSLLEKLIDLSISIKDVHLLKLAFKGELLLLKKFKNEEILNQKNYNKQFLSSLNNTKESNANINYDSKVEFNQTTQENISQIKQENFNQSNYEINIDYDVKEEEITKKDFTNKESEEDIKIDKITNYLNSKHYLTVMFNSKVDKLKKYKDRFEYISSYLNKTKWSLYVDVLLDSKILVASNGKIIIGISNREKYEKFKNFSLEMEFFNFVEELFGEKILLLPTLHEQWQKLSMQYKVLKEKNQRVNEEIFIPKFSEILNKTREINFDELFDIKVEIR